MNYSYLWSKDSRWGAQLHDQLTSSEAEISQAHVKVWSHWTRAAIIFSESTFILWAFVSSEVDLTVEHKATPASRLFLRKFPPALINPPCYFVGHPKDQPSTRDKVRHIFLLVLCSFVDQRECTPAGRSLPPFFLSPQLQTLVVVGDRLLDSLPLWMKVWMCKLGSVPVRSVHSNLRRMHGFFLLSASRCAWIHWGSHNNAASPSPVL